MLPQCMYILGCMCVIAIRGCHTQSWSCKLVAMETTAATHWQVCMVDCQIKSTEPLHLQLYIYNYTMHTHISTNTNLTSYPTSSACTSRAWVHNSIPLSNIYITQCPNETAILNIAHTARRIARIHVLYLQMVPHSSRMAIQHLWSNNFK